MNGEPLRDAVVQIKGFEKPLRLTKNAACFKALLPPGDYKLEVRNICTLLLILLWYYANKRWHKQRTCPG
jgi:hypothetical protein